MTGIKSSQSANIEAGNSEVSSQLKARFIHSIQQGNTAISSERQVTPTAAHGQVKCWPRASAAYIGQLRAAMGAAYEYIKNRQLRSHFSLVCVS